MSKPKKMGRPRLPKADVRKVFPVRLSDSERALFEQAAKVKGVTVPEWIRTTLTEAANR